MCIKKVEAWAYDGNTYPTEIDALSSAINHTIGNTGTAKLVLENLPVLLPLLDRYAEITEELSAGIKARISAGKDPAPDAPPMPPAAVRDLLASTFREKAKADKPGMQFIIRNAGYADLAELLENASDMHVNALLAKLVSNSVGGATLDAQGHDKSCRARATGFEADCRCGVLILNRTLYGVVS